MVFKVMNDVSYKQEDGTIILHASVKSDFVVSPITEKAHASAALLYQWVKGDLVLQAKVSQRFPSTYDVPVLIAMGSGTYWVKACFGYTDLHTRTVVSAIADTTLDSCSGVETDGDPI